MTTGARNKFGSPMFEPKVFRERMYCVDGSACDITGAFRCPPPSDCNVRGIVPRYTPSYAPIIG